MAVPETVTIKTALRPDFYEYFPLFSQVEMIERLEGLPFHLATHLTLPNLRTAIRCPSGKELIGAFLLASWEQQRQWLSQVLESVGIRRDIVQAIMSVPRENYVPEHLRTYSYINHSMHFDSNSCLTSPGLIALMIEKLDPRQNEILLEIGMGSGYHAACISSLLHHEVEIYGIEIDERYAQHGRAALNRAGRTNIHISVGDGSIGHPAVHAFDRIYIPASFDHNFPAPVLGQLRERGTIQGVRPITQAEFELEPVGSWLREQFTDHATYRRTSWRSYCCLTTCTYSSGQLVETSPLYDVQFTPLLAPLSSASRRPFRPAFDFLSQG